jgi:hypothetical protein
VVAGPGPQGPQAHQCLIKDIARNASEGPGKPEPLKYGFQTDLVQETFLAMAPAASAES